MVSRAEFTSARDAANISWLWLLQPAGMAGIVREPNVQISKATEANPRTIFNLDGLKGALFGYKDFSSYPAQARAAVGAARDSLERRIARALQAAPAIDGESLYGCLAGAHAAFDLKSYPGHNRFLLLSPAVWEQMLRKEPAFAACPNIWGEGTKLVGTMIWLRARYLEVQAVAFCRQALEGCIEPTNPTDGQAASAYVLARLAEQNAARVLRWSSKPQGNTNG